MAALQLKDNFFDSLNIYYFLFNFLIYLFIFLLAQENEPKVTRRETLRWSVSQRDIVSRGSGGQTGNPARDFDLKPARGGVIPRVGLPQSPCFAGREATAQQAEVLTVLVKTEQVELVATTWRSLA